MKMYECSSFLLVGLCNSQWERKGEERIKEIYGEKHSDLESESEGSIQHF